MIKSRSIALIQQCLVEVKFEWLTDEPLCCKL